MEIAESALKDELGMSKEDFEGIYALWKLGADSDELASAYKCSKLTMMWFFLMRGAGEGERPTKWVKPR